MVVAEGIWRRAYKVWQRDPRNIQKRRPMNGFPFCNSSMAIVYKTHFRELKF